MSAVASGLPPPVAVAGAGARAARRRGVLPGFAPSLGFTLFYLSLIVLIPLAALGLKTTELTWSQFTAIMVEPRVLASFRLTFGSAFAAAIVNVLAGVVIAWVLVRYSFPGRRFVDALIDLPFALPTAVAGIALTALYAPNGWLGAPLAALGIKAAFTPIGVLIAMIFIGLPFVVRTVQPVLEDLARELEEAAASLGAARTTTLRRVILPILMPAILTGFVLALSRAIGEYGSIIFIAGNIPMVSEITPLLIITRLEQYDYAGAAAIASLMLIASFALILAINLLQRWQQRRAP